MEKILKFVDDHPFYFVVSILAVSVIIAIIIVSSISYSYKAKCLGSDAPRRWHAAVCEQYQGGEWIEINPYNVNDIYYNEAAEGLK